MSEKRPRVQYSGAIYKDQLVRLKKLAGPTGLSVAHLVRQGIEELLAANKLPKDAAEPDPRQLNMLEGCTCPKGMKVFECPVHGAWMP